MRKEESIDANAGVSSSVVTFSAIDGVEKELTANDIRARIISIPSAIMKQFDDALDSIDVIVNNENTFHFNIIRGRNYFGGVTQLLRVYGFITSDGVIMPKRCKWNYSAGDESVKLFIER